MTSSGFSGSRQAVVFHVAGRLCAIDIQSVLNIRPYEGATPIPGAPRGVHGVLRFNDQPAVVVDMGVLCDAAAAVLTDRTCVLYAACTDGTAIGFLSDSIESVLDSADLAEVDVTRCPIPAELVEVMIRDGGCEVPLIAVSAVQRRVMGISSGKGMDLP